MIQLKHNARDVCATPSSIPSPIPHNKGIHNEKSSRIVRPYFSDPGIDGDPVHPYDELGWCERTAEIKNHKTGDYLFKQEGVVFPDDWSQLATNVVASKYFYGDVDKGNGSPKDGKREYGLSQLIDRVVGAITEAGFEQGVLDEESALHFDRELTWLLANQYGSFNSPVWFNVGLEFAYDVRDTGGKTIYGWDRETDTIRSVDPYERPQASACQPYRALVSTPDGMVPIGRLVEENAVGREVYDAHGTTRIVATKHSGRKDVLRLQLRSGNYVEVTGDHLVWTGGDSGRFVPARDVRVGDRMSLHARRPSEAGEALNVGEAALAGWLLSDGYVGKPESATSLVVEYETINDAERSWVERHNESVFLDVSFRQIEEETEGDTEYVRYRAYGERFRPFVDRYGLDRRGVNARVPSQLFEADLPAVRAFLRSVFEADGYVSLREGKSKRIGYQRISREFVEGVQKLLLRLGVFSRLNKKADPRPNRHDGWCLSIGNQSEIEAFAREVGFVSPRKQGLLDEAIARGGKRSSDVHNDEVVSIEAVGTEDVYDIQTESGEYLSGNVRVHNCFIISVDDDLDSIWQPVQESARLFVFGSGVGADWSKLRSRRDKLSGGGQPSGPASFMGVQDSTGGTIKSRLTAGR